MRSKRRLNQNKNAPNKKIRPIRRVKNLSTDISTTLILLGCQLKLILDFLEIFHKYVKITKTIQSLIDTI